MKLFALALLVGVAAAARLENTYLPPNSAGTAGGNGNFLATPSGQYGAPTGHASSQHQASFPSGQPSFNQFAQGQTQANFGSKSNSSPNHAAPQRHQQPSPVYGPANGASSRSNSADAHANTLRFDNDNDGTGNYKFEFETENKISQQEQGELKAGADGEVTVVRGSYSYIGDDGKTYTVNYIADENGFQPTGEHIDQAISKAAAEAGRSAGGQDEGYNYNAQQGQQGYTGQQAKNGQQSQNGGYRY